MTSGRIDKDRLALVLDTSAILRGFARQITQGIKFTTPNVLDELSKLLADSGSQLPIMNESSVQVRTPDEVMLKKVNETAARAGENSLSATDRSLLALSLELKHSGYDPVLVTDDYALQNVADILDLSYKSYIERGIRRRYKWKFLCTGCLREYGSSPGLYVCPVCGSKLRKRIIMSKKVNQKRS